MKRMSFEQWKEIVNYQIRILTKQLFDSTTLPDIDYFSLYSQQTTPKQAAKLAIRNALES